MTISDHESLRKYIETGTYSTIMSNPKNRKLHKREHLQITFA